MITIAIYKDNIEANIARGKLEANGIPCLLENEQTASLWPGQYVDIKLKVPEECKARAMEILE